MRKIKKELSQLMNRIVESDGSPTCSLIFPEDFIGFQGHFPERKLLPGVCQIQCIVSMIEAWKKKPVTIKEIVLARFLAPVFPLEELTCVCKDISPDDKDFLVKAHIDKGIKRVSEFRLRICFAG